MADEFQMTHSENQDLQRRLMVEAKRQPTIAEALAAYQAIQPYLPARPVEIPPQVRYATGGNS